MSDHRTNPEQSLQAAQNEEKKAKSGKLKIYLGAAPGVGKTYEMLRDAYESRVKNLDVVVGVVESHGREMIESMLNQFEIIPRQQIDYRDKKCTEFDLDVALKRDPGLILIDEMAHTNVPGLRHEKRWQDIKELLDRGIDVHTTLNVQHIESLKDDVAQIIQAPIKETVPDFMIERADTIELIDLPVDELLKRLHEGKIYFPEQAEQAVAHFFRKGNLIALRELALRTTAACVESEVLLYRKSEGIKQIWPTREKILVCVGANPESLKLIRTAKRMASSLQAEWMAVYVDIPHFHASTQKRNHAIQYLRLAQQLGAETHVLIGSDIVKEIMGFSRVNNITQIMVWKHETKTWRHFFKRHKADEILAHCGEINVYIVTGSGSYNDTKKIAIPHIIPWVYYAISACVVLGATILNGLLTPYVETSNLIMVYLLGVVLVASFGRIGPSIFASIMSVLSYDFLFLVPIDSFAIKNVRYILTLGMMFLMTQVISYLTLIKHREAQLANQIQKQTRALYTFSRKLLSTRGVDNVLALGTAYIAEIFKATVVAFLPHKEQLEIREVGYFKPILDVKERSVAQWVYDMGQSAGYGTDTLSSSDALYLPLLSSESSIGVLKIKPNDHVLYSPEQMKLLESCINQLSLALDVDRLQEKSRKKELKTEVDLARNTLLKTLSYHLNYPLKVILSAMHSSSERQVEMDRSEISDELGKISLINNNILQIIGFESETISLHKQQLFIQDIIYTSVDLYLKRDKNRPIKLDIPETLPLIFADAELLQEVFANLLDNANKFSPSESEIDIFVQAQLDHIYVSIENVGSEIAKEEIKQLFKKFYRGKQSSSAHGLGLGLTICQRIIEAHAGRIWVDNIEKKGIVAFRFILPVG
ncbi:MAG: sensor histidine kinase KdpD [Legionellaceae bacterium]|nr:sensor histidine kinase KdpD [Legionellaceae bacterium]